MIKANLDDSPVLAMLQKLESDDVENLVSDTFAKSYLHDIQDWILGGHAFEQHSGKLFRSIRLEPGKLLAGGGVERVTYAEYVEFGTKKARPFPFMFVDEENRKNHALDSVSLALGALLNANP